MSGSERGGQGRPANTRREHVRADDSIPVYYELEGSEGPVSSGLEWEHKFEGITPGPEENPKLYELLFEINQKIDILVDHLSRKSGLSIPEAREVNISGGGLRFNSTTEFREGDRLTLKTFLPDYAYVVKVSCEVLRVTPAGDGTFEVAVKYVDMDDSTREKIIKYIFAKQRKVLRTERGGDED